MLEGGWLLALGIVPLYFNPFSARIFEPDKVALFRFVVVLMFVAGAIRLLNRPDTPSSGGRAGTTGKAGATTRWQRLLRYPLAIPVTFYAAAFALATILSVEPRVSLLGSYARADGLDTHVAYVALFVLVTWALRTREQVERIVAVILYIGLAVAGYGLIQRAGLDPLPWNADVPERVTSTLGNPIFVGAYLAMITPFCLMRLASAAARAGCAPPTKDASADLRWALARLLLVIGTLALLLTVLKLLTVVRDSPGFVWVLPGAVATSVALWITGMAPSVGAGRPFKWLIGSVGIYLAALTLALFTTTWRGAPLADDRWIWLLGGLGGIAGWLLLFRTGAKMPDRPSRLRHRLEAIGMLTTLAVIVTAVILTQSRGPWLGLGAGVYVFLALLLWRSHADARAAARPVVAGRIKTVALAWVGMTALLVLLLVPLNTSDAPVFQALRSTPYVGRLGRIVETDSGTGLERRLFWLGDGVGGGALGLVLASPSHLLVGWGPETMAVVYEPFYPPSLGPLLRYLATDRYLAPDRAHQALLDVLVTRGVIGLASYLAVLLAFVVVALRVIRRATRAEDSLLVAACLASVLGSTVEQLVGIPIAATALLFWVALAVTARWAVSDAPSEPAPEPVIPTVQRSGQGRRQPRSGRSITERRATPLAAVVYGLLAVAALAAAWWHDLRPIAADVRFLEGRTHLEREPDSQDDAAGIAALAAAVRLAPEQDLYALVLGQGFARVAERRYGGVTPLGAPSATRELEDLLSLDSPEQVDRLLVRANPVDLLGYAEVAMERARALSPPSKEYPLALARLNRTWYEWTRDPSRLARAAGWYRAVTDRAPHDVPLLVERAQLVALQARAANGSDVGRAFAEEAISLLDRAERLQPGSPDTQRAQVEISQLR